MSATQSDITSDLGDLGGLPGLGPARLAMLSAAGITSRAGLAKTTVDQLVSLTGIPRAQAEKTIAALHTSAVAPEAPPMLPPVALTDEALPDVTRELPNALASEPNAPEAEPGTDLDRALFATRTALSDATRLLSQAGLNKSFLKLGLLLEGVSRRIQKLPPKQQARLTEQLNRLTARLEKAAGRGSQMKPDRVRRLRERLKEERQSLAAFVAAKPRRKAK